jgi:transporter family-2 protein
MNALWMFLALAMGVCVALQGSFNSALAARAGVGAALVINTLIVLAGAVVYAIAFSARPAWPALDGVRWHECLGGVCGFLIILAAVLAFPRLGAGLTLTLAIAAQLFTALALDHWGALGLPAHPLSWPRAAGAGLLIAGAVLVKLF